MAGPHCGVVDCTADSSRQLERYYRNGVQRAKNAHAGYPQVLPDPRVIFGPLPRSGDRSKDSHVSDPVLASEVQLLSASWCDPRIITGVARRPGPSELIAGSLELSNYSRMFGHVDVGNALSAHNFPTVFLVTALVTPLRMESVDGVSKLSFL